MTTMTTSEHVCNAICEQTRFRAEHLGPFDKSPFIDRALLFFQLSWYIRRQSQSELAEFKVQYPELQRYFELEAELKRTHAIKARKNKYPRGLLSYLSDLLGWSLYNHFIQTTETNEMSNIPRPVNESHRNTARKANTSSAETGRLVDLEAQLLSARKPLDTPTMHIYTRWLIQYLYQRGWLLCGTQVPLWDDTGMHQIATRADLICYDIEQNRYVLIELKTGYDHAYDTEFRPRLDDELRADCYMVRHQYQLGWMHHKLANRLQTAGGKLYSIVLRINQTNGVNAPHELDPDIEHYYANEHQKQSHKQVLGDSGNSIDPYAMTK